MQKSHVWWFFLLCRVCIVLIEKSIFFALALAKGEFNTEMKMEMANKKKPKHTQSRLVVEQKRKNF
jgi:hypothetical protein